MIWGAGNPNASLMILLDNPGAREDRDGNPFVCGTRQTLQKAAHDVGLTMDDLYVTYILKRRPTRKYDKPETRHTCMKHLDEQLKKIQPALIFCMGNVSVQSFFDDEKADVKSLRGHWHDEIEEHTSELQSRFDLVCRLLLEKKKTQISITCTRL